MAFSKMKLRVGVSDDPTALQPSLNDCLAAMLQQAEPLFIGVLHGLETGATAAGARRVQAFQRPSVKQAVQTLNEQAPAVTASFVKELTRLVYEGGGKDQQPTETLRFQDLQLFEDEQLDQSIEVARAQQEVATSVDDALPALDALISTMLGWRTIQPGLNPIRPDVFVRALQAALAEQVPDAQVREVLIVPAAGLLGVSLRRLYRELADWLRSTGVEPAVPLGGRINKATGASGAPVTDTVAKTLLTLDRLRKLLAGDFDQPKRADFMHTVPASMSMLQDMKKTDELVKRLEQRPKPAAAPAQPVDMLADMAQPARDAPRIGQQLGEEVVRLMFDNLGDDRRLLLPLKRQLKKFEPAVHRLTEQDSRFFSDRNHPARQLLDRITQRSLAFSSEQDPGWARFEATIDKTSRWLASKVIDADTFGEMLDELENEWSGQDVGAKQRREEAARALLHAEQRNLLAQKLAADFAQMLQGLDVADFIGDFLKNAWAQVVAEAQLSCADGSSDPFGYRQLVDDLIWSVQKSSSQRGRTRRLVQMIPGLLQRLREGLQGIGYPPELTQRFFDHLITLHRAAVQDGRDALEAKQAQQAADAAWAEESQFGDNAADEVQMWLDENEAQESGYLDEGLEMQTERVASPQAGHIESERAALEDARVREAAAETEAEAQAVPGQEETVPAALAEAEPLPDAPREELRIGTWAEITIKGEWVRAQLTWCSPHATLFMFTSIGGAAHSMSRRTLDKLRASGQLRVVADRPVVDEALDQVAQAALKNSVDKKRE
ncbi:MAG: hypothetical protein JWQ76_389 [Ramlibacter sp.]|nr:hypothetical protein [Ramlibacter sp.]